MIQGSMRTVPEQVFAVLCSTLDSSPCADESISSVNRFLGGFSDNRAGPDIILLFLDFVIALLEQCNPLSPSTFIG